MGLDQEGRGLYQYVVEDEAKRGGHDSGRGPRVIKLDDTPSRKQYVKGACLVVALVVHIDGHRCVP